MDELEMAMRLLRERAVGGAPINFLIGGDDGGIQGQDCTRSSVNYSRAQEIVNQLRNGSQPPEKKG